MKLKLIRKYKKDKYTIGKLYIDGAYFCDTLEDKDRGLHSTMNDSQVKGVKIKGVTAIPTGIYKVTLNVQSPKYSAMSSWKVYNNGYMPRLLNVVGFDGILIHTGNTDMDTDGCILVGNNKQVGRLINSTSTFKTLYQQMQDRVKKGEQIEIEICY